MGLSSTRLLALSFALALMGAARPEQVFEEEEALQTRAAEEETAREQVSPKVAWDCVPSYWWGYWTWAWQPCAWIDRSYVEGTIGAIADAHDTQPKDELSGERPPAATRSEAGL
jgi:hypothetical protein